MRVSIFLKNFLLVTALLLAVNAFASNKGSFQISHSVTISGTQLAPGSYAVKWEGNGPDVQVSILKGRNVVATVPAHIVNLNSAAANDSAVITNNSDGSSSLAQLRFGGKKFALDLNGG